MKSRDIWEMMPDEIRNKLDDAHAELFNLRFQFSIGQMQNSARLGQVRRDIARLSTVLRAKQLQPKGFPSKASPGAPAERAEHQQSGQGPEGPTTAPVAKRGGRSK